MQKQGSGRPSRVPLPTPGTANSLESGCLPHPRHQYWFPTNSSEEDNLAVSGHFQSHFFLALRHLLLLQES